MRPIDRIRQQIAKGAPYDDHHTRRLAFLATGRLDPATAQVMQALLQDALLDLVLARELGAPEQVAAAERDVDAALAVIDGMSKPQ